MGVGLCKAGIRTCVKGGWGPCSGEVIPGVEICNGKDDNCNGVPDYGVPQQTWYLDDDGDGYGAGTGTIACGPLSAKHVTKSGDCCDKDKSSHPGAGHGVTVNNCGSWDRDCDSTTSEYSTKSASSCASMSRQDCIHKNFWLSSVPGCGVIGTMLRCRWDVSSCVEDSRSSETQTCK